MDGVRSLRQLDLLLSRATDLLCRQRHLRSMGWGRQGNFGTLRTRIEGGAVLRSGWSMGLGYPSYSYSLTRMTSCSLFSRLTSSAGFRSRIARWLGVKTNVGVGGARLLKRLVFENSNQWPIRRCVLFLLICPRMGSDKRFKVRMREECGDGKKGKREATRGRGGRGPSLDV